MAAAFTLTLAYLGEHYSAADSASAFAAYITGNVASNLIGRLISAAVADHFGLASNFYFFAVLNLLGAVLVYFTIDKTPCMNCVSPAKGSHFTAWTMHLKNPRPARELRHRLLHPVRLYRHVHLRQFRPGATTARRRRHDARLRLFRVPSRHGDHAAGGARRRRFGTRPAFWAALGVAALGLPLLLLPSLPPCCSAWFWSEPEPSSPKPAPRGSSAARRPRERGAASGLYLACYFFGGLVGSAVLGPIFDMFGWEACVAGIGVALLVAALLAIFLKTPMAPRLALEHNRFRDQNHARRAPTPALPLAGGGSAVAAHFWLPSAAERTSEPRGWWRVSVGNAASLASAGMSTGALTATPRGARALRPRGRAGISHGGPKLARALTFPKREPVKWAQVSRHQVKSESVKSVRGTVHAHDLCSRRHRRVDRVGRLLPPLAAGLQRADCRRPRSNRKTPDQFLCRQRVSHPGGSGFGEVACRVGKSSVSRRRARRRSPGFFFSPSRGAVQNAPCAQVLTQKSSRTTAPAAPAATSALSQLRFLSASAMLPP